MHAAGWAARSARSHRSWGGTRVAAADLLTVAVEGDDVPGPEIVAVVPGLWVASSLAEVAEVARRVLGLVVVVAGRRACPVLVSTPGRLVAVGELTRRALPVDVVTEGNDRSRDVVQESSRGLVGLVVAARDVTRPHQHRRGLGR